MHSVNRKEVLAPHTAIFGEQTFETLTKTIKSVYVCSYGLCILYVRRIWLKFRCLILCLLSRTLFLVHTQEYDPLY